MGERGSVHALVERPEGSEGDIVTDNDPKLESWEEMGIQKGKIGKLICRSPIGDYHPSVVQTR